MKNCTIKGCTVQQKYLRRSMCDMHYRRLQRNSKNLNKPSSLNHGMRSTPEYRAWCHMKERCYNPNIWNYHRYGGRGIEVYPLWRRDFHAFFNYIGKRPEGNYSLDRINNDGNYEPGNVRWSTAKEQANNRRMPSRSY